MCQIFNSAIQRPLLWQSTVLLILTLFSAELFAWQTKPYPPYSHYYTPAPAFYSSPYPQQAFPPAYIPATYYPTYPVPPRPAFYGQPYPYQHMQLPELTVEEQVVIQQKLEQPASRALPEQESPAQPIDVSLKKKGFMEKLLPFIEQENTRLAEVRTRLQQIFAKLDQQQSLPDSSKAWIDKLVRKYKINGNPLTQSSAREELEQKIDIIPASLTLAQAANESAWGQSRFATEANNLFGIWTYDKNKGLIPQNRDAEKKHLIRKFEHVGESVAYYMLTLNRHPAYQKLRDIRQQLRAQQQNLDGHALAEGLEKYSARGEQYIQLIQDLIRQNEWNQLDQEGGSAA